MTDANVERLGVACNDSILLEVEIEGATGDIVYEWQDGAATTTYWATPGTYSVTVTDSLGCSGSDGYEVYYNNEPVAEFAAPNVCLGEELVVDDQSYNYAEQGVTPLNLTDWAWDFGDGVGTSSDQSPTYVYSEPGQYEISLLLTNENNCLDSFEFDVLVHPLAELAVSAPTTCIGEETQMVNNSQILSGSIASWSWDLGDAGATSTEAAPQYTYPDVGTYDITVSAETDQGCEDDTTIQVLITPEATADFTYIAEPNCGEENLQIFFTNESENAAAYLWDFGTVTDTATNPIYSTPEAYGPFVSMIAYGAPGEAACSDTATLDITDLFLIIDFDTINAGNVITPNGDGLNDCLAPFWHESYEECYRLRIWDRWGMFIYDSDDVSEGHCWPGTDRKGQPVQDGTFFFVAEVNNYSRSGSVIVTR